MAELCLAVAWLALPLPLLMLLWPLREQYGRRAARALRTELLQEQAPSRAGAVLQTLLLSLAWLCPGACWRTAVGEPIELPRQARQMMLAVDLSGSMSEPDMQLGGQVVDRSTAAKAVLAMISSGAAKDALACWCSASVMLLTPLTADRATVRDQLRDSVVGLAGRETALGDAIALSVKRLREQLRDSGC